MHMAASEMYILCGFADVFHLIHFYLVGLTLDNCSCEQFTNQIARLPVSPRQLVVLALFSVRSDPRLLTFLFPHPYLSHPGQNLLAVSLRLLVSDHYQGCQSPRQPSSFGLHLPPELLSLSWLFHILNLTTSSLSFPGLFWAAACVLLQRVQE